MRKYSAKTKCHNIEIISRGKIEGKIIPKEGKAFLGEKCHF